MAEKKQKDIPFEKALGRLEEIVDKLEAGELPLEEAITLFEEGNGMAKTCRAKLDAAGKKIDKLIRDRSGDLVTEEMDDPTSGVAL